MYTIEFYILSLIELSIRMSKKLINSPTSAVDEALSGLVGANPDLRLLQGHRVIVRADIKSVIKQNKVSFKRMQL